jgi:hypothetical protein
MARPKADIDLKQVEALAGLQCTDEEIAAVLGVNVRTITRKKAQKNSSFVQAYKKGKEKGKTSLRRIQWQAAQGITWEVWKCDKKQSFSHEYICTDKKSKNKPECNGCDGARRATITDFKGGATGMQIWLGKQWLGQADKQEVSGKGGGPIGLGFSMSDGIKAIRNQLKSDPEEEKRLLGEAVDE